LIKSDKAAGAALATLLTQSFIALTLVGLAIREFKLPMNVMLIGRPVLFALLTGVVCYIGTDYMTFDWRANFILAGLIALGLAFVLKLISVKDLIHLMKNRN